MTTHTARHALQHLLAGAVLACAAACGGGSSPAAPTTTSSAPTPSSSSSCSAIHAASTNEPDIVNGGVCAGPAPSVVLLKIADAGGNSLGDCSATVIAPRAVLAAAHCFEGGAAHVQVVVNGSTSQAATAFSASPQYQADRTSPVDIGIAIVGQDLPVAAIPLLTSRAVRVGETALIAGYGLDETHAGGGTLRAGQTTITAVNDFIETTYGTSAGVCQGDSGGALLVNQSGTWGLAGVISGGSTAACNSGQGYYAIVNTPQALAFIASMVPNTSAI